MLNLVQHLTKSMYYEIINIQIPNKSKFPMSKYSNQIILDFGILSLEFFSPSPYLPITPSFSILKSSRLFQLLRPVSAFPGKPRFMSTKMAIARSLFVYGF